MDCTSKTCRLRHHSKLLVSTQTTKSNDILVRYKTVSDINIQSICYKYISFTSIQKQNVSFTVYR